MCKLCVDEGVMTAEQLDEAVLAGDQSVIAFADRIAAGQDPAGVLLDFFNGMTTDQLLAFVQLSDDEIIDLLSGARYRK